LRGDEKQPSKKRPNVSSNSIFSFFVAKKPFKKNDVQQKKNLEDLILLIVKNHLHLQFVKSSWLKKFSMHLCLRIIFPSRISFFNELLSGLVEKTKQLYGLLILVECHFATKSFDLWMSKVGHDIFTLMITFLGDDLQPKHITLGLFEPTDITRQTSAKKLIKLLDNYALRRKIIVYVKDEGSNLNNMTIALKSIVSCDMLGLKESF